MIAEAKKWLEQAEEDLETAKYTFNGKKYKAASFWCQQCAEKALKSFLINKNKEMPKIHDLVKLGKIVNLDKELLDKCEKLTYVYIESRYPDVIQSKYNPKETEDDIKIAGEVLKWIKENI